ncbi:MAG: hypothetical protein AB8B55_10450 [Mariniblastus sp.]
MDQTLYKRLKPVVRRIQFRRVAISLAIIWCLGAIIAGAIFFLNQNQNLDPARIFWFVAGGTVLASLLAAANAFYHSKTPEQVAAALEEQYPDLDATLITAVEQRRVDGERLGFLQQDVLRRAVTHSYTNSWPSMIPGWHLIAAPIAGMIGLIAFAVAMVCLVFYTKPLPSDPTISFADALVDQSNYQISIEPGNAEIEKGASLLVLARFAGAIPPDATLVFTGADDVESRLAMTKSLDDPVFGARVASVETPISYRVEFASDVTDEFQVNIFEYPKLIRADAALTYPAYTELEKKVIQDARRLNAVEGSTIDMTFFVNKPVTNAWLFPVGDKGEGQPVELITDSQDPRKLTAKIEMNQSQKYELQLVDSVARENRTPPKFTFNMLINRAPDLKITAPGRDIQASSLEEVQLSANAWDDFGLKAFGLTYGIAGQETKDLVLEQKAAGKKRKKVDHLMALEDLKAKPDDLVSYHFWAEDIGPDGNARRVMGDMFFAEVRSFDEIFRQGQAPPAGEQQQQQQQQQNQSAQQAQELAELQKEIINGTWKVIRRELRDTVTDKFAADTELLSQSQTEAISKLDELAAELEDEKSKSYVEVARAFMNEAVLHLNESNRDDKPAPLKPALSSEQAAYQGLLKLRAREHEVVLQQQQQQQSSSSQQQNRQRQQMDQLNLKEDENRYENEKTAQEQSEQATQQQEDRQVLSRLRELSRRQEDLNERVKELQTALEEANSEEEKEEIERRLKSLREQQEQMLRDTDDLLDRMQQEENQQRMSEESEKLEETRESLQRASEALKQNEPSRAAAEGTRAQRDLEELRDEFQNRTAGQFTEEMRQMRNEAQELDEKEKEIAEKLADQMAGNESPKSSLEKDDRAEEKAPSLRDGEEAGDLKSLEEEIGKQQLAVEELREKMRKTITEAEEFEPLLADELYDTYRKSEATRPDEALRSARRSVQRGWAEDAIAEEEKARKGIEQIREGIEKAAESVLGDETQALKAAQEKLRDLNRQLDEEIDSQDPKSKSNQRGSRADGEESGEDSDEREGGSKGDPEDGRGSAEDRSRERDEQDETRREEDRRKESEGRRGQGQRQGQSQSEQERGEGPGEPSDGEPQEGEQQDREPRAGESQQEGQGQGEGQGQSESESENEGQQGRGGQSQNGQPQGGQRNGQQGRGGDSDSENETELQRIQRQMRELSEQENEGSGQSTGRNQGPGNQRMMRPISGDDFREWSDQLRDVEEMIADPELRAEASRIRQQARELRKEMKERHSAQPNWDLVKMKIARPLAELKDRVAEEIMRRGSKDALVPLDRDPVPVEYQDAVRRYYERLGSGK